MKARVSALSNASIVTGTLSGLAEGIGYWKAGEITEDMLAKLVALLSDTHAKAKLVSDALLNDLEG